MSNHRLGKMIQFFIIQKYNNFGVMCFLNLRSFFILIQLMFLKYNYNKF